jgi:hypothetical protein
MKPNIKLDEAKGQTLRGVERFCEKLLLAFDEGFVILQAVPEYDGDARIEETRIWREFSAEQLARSGVMSEDEHAAEMAKWHQQMEDKRQSYRRKLYENLKREFAPDSTQLAP